MKEKQEFVFPWMELGLICNMAACIIIMNTGNILLSGSILVCGWVMFWLSND